MRPFISKLTVYGFIHDVIGIRVRFFLSLALLFVPLVGVETLDQCSLEYHYL